MLIPWVSSIAGEFHGVGKRGEASVQLARILQYLECPQYLRKTFFPQHKDLQYAGKVHTVCQPGVYNRHCGKLYTLCQPGVYNRHCGMKDGGGVGGRTYSFDIYHLTYTHLA